MKISSRSFPLDPFHERFGFLLCLCRCRFLIFVYITQIRELGLVIHLIQIFHPEISKKGSIRNLNKLFQ